MQFIEKITRIRLSIEHFQVLTFKLFFFFKKVIISLFATDSHIGRPINEINSSTFLYQSTLCQSLKAAITQLTSSPKQKNSSLAILSKAFPKADSKQQYNGFLPSFNTQCL